MDVTAEPRHSVLREAHLRDYWRIVWQGRWTVLAVFTLVLGATALWTFLQVPIYRSTAIVEVQPQARSLLTTQDVSGMGAAGYGWFAEEKYHNTQIEIIKSRDVANEVVSTLRLEDDPDFEGHPDVANAFRGMIMVEPRRDTGLLEISMYGTDKNKITRRVNAVATAYVGRNLRKAEENVEQSVESIRTQLKQLNTDLQRVELERIETLQDTQIFDADSQEEILREKLKHFSNSMMEVSIKAQSLSGVLLQIERMRKEGADLQSLQEFADDDTLELLYRDRVQLEQELERAKVELRPDHPEYQKTEKALRTVEGRIQHHVDRIASGLRREYDQEMLRKDVLEEQIRETEIEALQIAKATSRYETKRIEADTTRQIFDVITKTMQEVQLSSQLLNNNVNILDNATIPLYPIKPRKKVNLALGAMLGMFLGLAAVFFLDYLDNTIRTPEDVEKYLGLSVLGVVPKMADPDLSQRALREAFQSMRTSVIFSSKNRQSKIVLTTSTGPREGKSSTVANLGRTLAAAGDRVIIIDCDLRKPRQHAHHNLEREPGLTNYLAAPEEDRDWRRYLRVSAPNLDVLTCGPIPPSPPELLGNTRFTDLIATLRETYDWVLVDSPPAANLADASVLASLAEMVILVVRHNSTDRDHVMKTFQQIRAVNPAVAGVVLNNVDLDRTYHRDYYYAGYYYQEEETDKKSRKGALEPKAHVG